jgi:hypothetical protein
MQREANKDLIITHIDRRHNTVIGCGPRSEHAQYKKGCTASCSESTFFMSKPSPIEVRLHQSEGRRRCRQHPTRRLYPNSAGTGLKDGQICFNNRGEKQEHV